MIRARPVSGDAPAPAQGAAAPARVSRSRAAAPRHQSRAQHPAPPAPPALAMGAHRYRLLKDVRARGGRAPTGRLEEGPLPGDDDHLGADRGNAPPRRPSRRQLRLSHRPRIAPRQPGPPALSSTTMASLLQSSFAGAQRALSAPRPAARRLAAARMATRALSQDELKQQARRRSPRRRQRPLRAAAPPVDRFTALPLYPFHSPPPLSPPTRAGGLEGGRLHQERHGRRPRDGLDRRLCRRPPRRAPQERGAQGRRRRADLGPHVRAGARARHPARDARRAAAPRRRDRRRGRGKRVLAVWGWGVCVGCLCVAMF